MDGVFRGLAGLLRGISRGRSPKEIPRINLEMRTYFGGEENFNLEFSSSSGGEENFSLEFSSLVFSIQELRILEPNI